MKRILSIVVLALAALVCVPEASAKYSPEMAELAKLMNNSLQGEGEGLTVDYDGNNIIINFPTSYFSEDEIDLLNGIDGKDLKPIMVKQLQESLGEEMVQMFGTMFEMFDTNMVIRLKLGKTPTDIVMTSKDLLGK